MKTIERYIQSLLKCDSKSLADTFAPEGILCDYCPSNIGKQEYHIYGREAVDMFFKNKFTFRKYIISEVEIMNNNQAKFIASIDGYKMMAIATLRKINDNGLIELITVRPK